VPSRVRPGRCATWSGPSRLEEAATRVTPPCFTAALVFIILLAACSDDSRPVSFHAPELLAEGLSTEVWENGALVGTLQAGRLQYDPVQERIQVENLVMNTRPGRLWSLLLAQTTLPALLDGTAWPGTPLKESGQVSGTVAPSSSRSAPPSPVGLEVRDEQVQPSPAVSIPGPEEPLEVSAERFTGDAARRTGRFEGGVHLQWGAMTLDAETLTLISSSEPGRGVGWEAGGAVRFRVAPWAGRANRVTYDPEKSLLVLLEDAHLKGERSEMAGARVELQVRTGRVTCEQCTIRWILDERP